MVSGTLDAPRRRAHHLRRHDRRDAQHRRRGPAGARRRAGPRRRAEARHDRRRGDPDRPHGDGARRPRSPPSSAATTIVGPVIEAGRASRREALADADPARHRRAGPRQQDRRPGPARLGALGRRAAGRGVPRASSPPTCPGPTSTSPARASTPARPTATCTTGGTGFAADRRWSTTPAGSAALLSLLPTDVLPHPLRDADDRRPRTPGCRVALAELVGPVHRRHPAPGPLAVAGDEQQGHVADGRARLDEPLDPAHGCR